MKPLIQIEDLVVNFFTDEGTVIALNHVNLDINRKETLGLVGETGCGKTMTALSIFRLVPDPGQISAGSIYFNRDEGTEPVNLLTAPESTMRQIRGSQISMVFQEPGNALNPVYTIGNQIAEVFMLHKRGEVASGALDKVKNDLDNPAGYERIFTPARILQKKLYSEISRNPRSNYYRIISKIPIVRRLFSRLEKQALEMAANMLREVDIPDSDRIVNYYPHQLSGGMKQRAVIAMALACSPRFLIADEPTTALDVTIQAQILDLLRRLKEEFSSSVLYITHDLGVAAAICDRVGVMYAGSICELADVYELYANPVHPYTRSLLAAVPKPGEEPKPIPGFIPDPNNPPPGCQFNPRCPKASEICRQEMPALREISPGHMVSCHVT